MNRRILVLGSTLVYVCAWVALACAQVTESSAVQPKFYGNVPYVSGGVGLDEREALSQVSKDYNLKLSFAQTSGNYLGEVAVRIVDPAGQVTLEAVSDGPWFFCALPAGRYTVVVKTDDKTQQKTVTVSERGQVVLNFFWQ